jgi:hypothetical protein
MTATASGSDPLAFDDAEDAGIARTSASVRRFHRQQSGRLALYSQNLDGGYSAPGFSPDLSTTAA